VVSDAQAGGLQSAAPALSLPVAVPSLPSTAPHVGTHARTDDPDGDGDGMVDTEGGRNDVATG